MTYKTLFSSAVRKLSLCLKFLLLLSFVSASVVITFALHDYWRTRQAAEADLEALAVWFPEKISRTLGPMLAAKQYAMAEDMLGAELQDRRIACAAYASKEEQGAVFGFIRRDGRIITTASCSGSGKALFRSHPVRVDGKTLGTLAVAYSPEQTTQALRAIVHRALLELLVLIPALCLSLYIAIRYCIFSPLRQLADTAQQIIDTQNFTARTPVANEDEVGRLAMRFNMMLNEIELRDRQLQSHSQVLEEEISVRGSELAQKNAELEKANKRLLELDQLKSGFLSTVSHDLRTPLTSILGFSKLINQDFCKLFLPFAGKDKKLLKRGERIKHNLRIIQHEGERLTRLINDFLDLSRIESGRMQWRDTDLSIRTLANRAVEAVQGQFDLKPDVELRLDVQDALPMIHCDEDRMMQVLVNLLNNAAKFTSAGHVLLRAFRRHDKLRIEVQDTGPGIPQDQLAKIFDKFHKVEEAEVQREKKPAGTGLGLAICRETILHYNGRIWAESEQEKGSTFVIELSGFQKVLPAACIMEPRPDDAKTRVLVVDDNAFIREFFEQLLTDADYEVQQAKNGEQALEKARETVPDLIVMDLLMPGMGGEMAIRHFRSDPKLACVPILIISISQDSIDYSGDARLEKPVEPERVLEVVNSLLRKRRTHSPVLVVGNPESLPTDLVSGSETVAYIDAEAVAGEIEAGFRGTVVLSRNTLNELDLNLHEQPSGLNFLIVGCA